MSNIKELLLKLFRKQRIVFWYDINKEFRREFETLDIDDVTSIELANNEFNVKQQILRREPDRKFLLYHEGPEPEKKNNWLLDVQLAHTEFRTDQASIHLADLGLGTEFSELTRIHTEFFRSNQRKEALKKILDPRDSEGIIRLKMIGVCVDHEPRIDVILEGLLQEFAVGKQHKYNLLQRSGLEGFFWSYVEKQYGYRSETKSIHDFAIELFKSCYGREVGYKVSMGTEAVIFLKRWKDSVRYKADFEKISNDCAVTLGLKKDLQERDYTTLMAMDYFRLIDMKIISDLVQAVSKRTISAGECAMAIRERKQSHWYDDLYHLYEAVEYGSAFFFELDKMELQVDSFSEGIRKYCSSWFRIDQLYRKYLFHERKSGAPTLLSRLSEQIEELYTNNFLLVVNDQWQQQVDNNSNWQSPIVPMQNTFYSRWVAPINDQNKKVYVIISDALRYEVGEELLRRIVSEDRYDAKLEPMVSMLPSYTQLGMAALLPHKAISISGGNSVTVMVDDCSTQGIVNRGKILNGGIKDGGGALKADDFLDMSREECREIMRENSVIYIYHNRIDAIGDKLQSEGRVFEAVEDGTEELLKIIKKLTANNATNMVVTSDHGFIYQNKSLDDSDYSSAEAKGTEINYQDRRFLIGKGLEEHKSLKHFTTAQLGLTGDVDVQISKSINRMRQKGAGSRFVHGGASLQEIVVPVLKVNKKRKSDVQYVDVDIIRSGSHVITSGQLTVTFYQTEPVSGKILPRALRAAIYTKGGELLSDIHDLLFDFASEESRERERKVRVLLNRKAEDVNGQAVLLKLQEKVSGTSQFKEYKTVSYTMQRSFVSDFDL